MRLALCVALYSQLQQTPRRLQFATPGKSESCIQAKGGDCDFPLRAAGTATGSLSPQAAPAAGGRGDFRFVRDGFAFLMLIMNFSCFTKDIFL